MTEARMGAEKLGDRSLLGWVLNRQAGMFWIQLRMREAIDSGLRATEELRAVGDLWWLAEGLGFTQMSLVFCGRLDEVGTLGDELYPLAFRLGHNGSVMFTNMSRGWSALNRTADLNAFEAFSRGGIEEWQLAGPWSVIGYLFLGWALMFKGRWEEAQDTLQDGIGLEPPDSYAGHLWGGLLLAAACAGNRDARQLFESKRSELPRAGENATQGVWSLLLGAVEAMATLGERDEAADLYPLVLEGIETGTALIGFHSLLQKIAGIAAAAAGRWDEAETHLKTALIQAHEIPVRIEQPEVRRWYAWMLLDRDGPGDREKARKLLEEAVEAYKEIGMPKHVEIAEELLAKAKG